jgi:hypothetical protein
MMPAHQILSSRQFAHVVDLPEEKSVTSTKLRGEIPEPEDEPIGAEGTRMSGGAE